MKLASPPDMRLPFFTYGLFKPDEPAYVRIGDLLAEAPLWTGVAGALWVRDGLPLLELDEGGATDGFLLTFRPEAAAKAYATICDFEPAHQYRWGTCDEARTSKRANVLLGRSSRKGSIQFYDSSWTYRADPLLVHGPRVVESVIGRSARSRFDGVAPDDFDWPRLLDLEMGFLLLWVVLERWLSLTYGPDLDPMAKVKRLGTDRLFISSLQATVKLQDRRASTRLYDSRDPDKRSDLDPADALKSAHYYYLARSNLTHRGKAAWRDADIVLDSLCELHAIVSRMFREQQIGP